MALKILRQPLINFSSHITKCTSNKRQIYSSAKCTINLSPNPGRIPHSSTPSTYTLCWKHQCRELCTRAEKVDDRTGWVYDKLFTPELDLSGFEDDFQGVVDNVSCRKGDADVNHILQLWRQVHRMKKEYWEKLNQHSQVNSNPTSTNSKPKELEESSEALQRLGSEIESAEHELYQCAAMLPNRTHPAVLLEEDAEPNLLEEIGSKPKFDFPIQNHIDLGESLDILRFKHLGHITGHRSYFLKGAGAQLEEALVRYTMDRLVAKGFKMISVPDIIKPVPFEGCGMRTKGLHTQVYKIDDTRHPGGYCLSGTAEVGIAGYFMDRTFELKDLPQKVAAVSRCFRAETSGLAEARGLYRVHQFTKVEMFAVVANELGDESERTFRELSNIQKDLFSDLGLHFQVLDMPAHDLGAPAFRKFDMEAWMPARKTYGEISSTSTCTDYQSRRLKIKYRMPSGETKYVHTLNGTACAVPRMIIAILENFQQPNRTVAIPKALQPYMYGQSVITRPTGGLFIHTRL